MGAEIPAPETGAAALAENFTNEGGVFGTTRFLKNIMGLWLVQQLRKALAKAGHDLDYAALAAQAAAAPAFAALVDPDHPSFLAPLDMAEALRQRCAATGQRAPATPGGLARLCFESLALKYRTTLEGMERVLGRRFGTIHIVGGGSKNALLCRMTADCCRRPVVAGPAEGTALGNLMMQAHALGDLASLADIRAVVRASSETADYEPDPAAASAWDEQYGKFLALPG
jgi:rhamnulokinase